MRRVLTGYAGALNRRHSRHGYLFQDRYQAIRCQGETYLLELVRDVRLNPVRGWLVKDYRALDRFPWSGHSALLATSRGRGKPWVRCWNASVRAAARPGGRTGNLLRMVSHRSAVGVDWGVVRSARGRQALTSRRRLGDRLAVMTGFSATARSSALPSRLRESASSGVKIFGRAGVISVVSCNELRPRPDSRRGTC